MKPQVTPQAQVFPVYGISVSHIIFDDSDEVSLWAQCRINNEVQRVHILCSVRLLNDLLRYSGHKGDEITLAMAEAITSTEEPPYVIDLQKLLGHNAVITTCKLDLSKYDASHTSAEHWYQLCALKHLSNVAQAKHLSQNIQDFRDADAIYIDTSHSCINITELAKQYCYYLGLLELDVNEQAARERSKLTDEALYKMAKMMH